MSSFSANRRISVADAARQIPGSSGERYAVVFEHGTLEVELYQPREVDSQQPHRRDEAYIVATGSGTFVVGSERLTFGPGDFLFAPAGVPHRFEYFSSDLSVWVIFYGPDGGEKPSP
ncbi:MAG TPA: cupin domain-containing protein [Steroidobacteraceae bacterium]|nr:cupin domain-containing protein [Steroidobacteraceae bacterium]